MLKVYGRLRMHVAVVGTARLQLFTEAPGGRMVERFSHLLTTTTTRTITDIRLPGAIVGQLFQPVISQVSEGGEVILYSMEVWAKKIGHAGDSPWTWYPIPVTPTVEEWSKVPLRIEATPDEWTRIPLRITPTPDEWSRVEIPELQSRPTPVVIDLPVDEV